MPCSLTFALMKCQDLYPGDIWNSGVRSLRRTLPVEVSTKLVKISNENHSRSLEIDQSAYNKLRSIYSANIWRLVMQWEAIALELEITYSHQQLYLVGELFLWGL